MKRRGFLKLLALLPFAPKLAEAAAQTIKKPEMWKCTDYAVNGSDQTSIWLVNWGDEMHIKPTLLDVTNKYHYNSLPIVEALSQKNHLLQDTKWAHEQIDLWGKL